MSRTVRVHSLAHLVQSDYKVTSDTVSPPPTTKFHPKSVWPVLLQVLIVILYCRFLGTSISSMTTTTFKQTIVPATFVSEVCLLSAREHSCLYLWILNSFSRTTSSRYNKRVQELLLRGQPISSVVDGREVQVVTMKKRGLCVSPEGHGASLQVRVNTRNNLVMGQATDLRASSTPISHQGLHYAVLLASNLQHTCRAIWRLSHLIKILFWLEFGVEMSWWERT